MLRMTLPCWGILEILPRNVDFIRNLIFTFNCWEYAQNAVVVLKSYFFGAISFLEVGIVIGAMYVLDQSRKNPVSASAMLTGKFLQIRKVFGTSSLLAEEFPDTLQYKISR